MFISRVFSKGKNGKSYVSVLLRESYRIGKHVKTRTLAVLTKLPATLIAHIERGISKDKDATAQSLQDITEGELSLRQGDSFGALWVVSELTAMLGINKALGGVFAAQLALWQVIARVVRPGISLLGMMRLAASSAAASILDWKQKFCEDDLYANGE